MKWGALILLAVVASGCSFPWDPYKKTEGLTLEKQAKEDWQQCQKAALIRAEYSDTAGRIPIFNSFYGMAKENAVQYHIDRCMDRMGYEKR